MESSEPPSYSLEFDAEQYEIDLIKSNPRLLKEEKRRIMKNLIFICISFMCNFTAFNGSSVLQSSLNDDDGLGVGSLAIIYGTLIISALFMPTIVIKKLGCKWTIVVAICGYVTYSLANFYPSWGTLVPSSIIVGFSAAPLWSAKSAYLTTTASRYAKLVDDTKDALVNTFFGIFFFFFQATNIIGNLISSFVLSNGVLEFPSCYNETFIEDYCGASDCPSFDTELARNQSSCGDEIVTSDNVEKDTVYLLMGIYAAIGLLGAFITGFFVDPIQLRNKEDRSLFYLVTATLTHMKDKRQLLLIPITMYSGFEQAFVTGDYTKSFITCPLGVNWVGFVLICYGACDSVFSITFGRLEKYSGRIVLFILAAIINLALLIVFLLWKPYPDGKALFFLLIAFWGVSDAVWQTQLNSLYGVLFLTNQEAAFANYRLWESLGFVISFAYQGFVCVEPKIWVTLGVLIVSMITYAIVEIVERKRLKREITLENEPAKKEYFNEAFKENLETDKYIMSEKL